MLQTFYKGEEVLNKVLLVVDEKYQGKKLREYLKHVEELSSRLIRSAAKDGRISVNGKVVTLRYEVQGGDKIELDVVKDESQDIAPENMPLEIVYEDSDVIVVNKRPFMVVHPTKSYQSGTLANGLLYYFQEKGEDCIVRLVSRLDMNTSGLILAAKNQFAHMALARDMQKGAFDKRYVAVVHGNLENTEGVIDASIYKPEGPGVKRVIDEKGQRSITRYKVIERTALGDLVELQLETGRTHQIRVHMESIGHPIFGDSLYCDHNDEEYINRQALHGYKLTFPRPRTGEKITLEIDMPKDMKELMEKIRN